VRRWCAAVAAALLLLATQSGSEAAEQSCPTVHDPTARCGRVVDRGGDFVNEGTVLRTRDRVVLINRDAQWRSVNVIAYDARTMARLFARNYLVKRQVVLYSAALGEGGRVALVAGVSVANGTSGSYVAAFSTRDGGLLWSQESEAAGRYDAPVVTADARRAYVARHEGGTDFVGRWTVTAYDVRTGRELWRTADRRTASDAWPAALAVTGDRLVVVGSGGGDGCGGQPRVDVLTTSGRLLSSAVDQAPGCGMFSGVTVAGRGRVVAVGWTWLGAAGTETGIVRAVDAVRARPLWQVKDNTAVGGGGDTVAVVGDRVLVGAHAIGASGGIVVGDAWAPVPQVVALDLTDGHVLWQQQLPSSSTRFGRLRSLALSPDGRVVYAAGGEGTPEANTLVDADVRRRERLGSTEAFVRALEVATGKELWVGRRPVDANEPGTSGSEVFGLVPLAGSVLAVGTSLVTVWTSGSGRARVTSGLVMSFAAR
jgi:outer membrane protein assembly factor BamB